MEVWCLAADGVPIDETGVKGVWWDGGNWQGFTVLSDLCLLVLGQEWQQ
jgi:hypothetical protein